MTLTTLVTGPTAAAREAAIANTLEPGIETALILEGLPDGRTSLATYAGVSGLQIARIAPGCLCCTGNLTMRVTLNRILRHPPARLYIGLATSEHLERIREFLTCAPYDKLLQITKDLHA
ncbi:GTPase [Noviherbaspirillum sp.]|uniref:GTPase n=1 Tax=Noviherbaspirillum sp. TaxID=1926288 RepID=UPI002B49024E|nr:GTPase [Noviherbaspirillum sp.]HJV83283.1 GTPase [Noviherbaspirillum sp.]